MMPRQSGDYMPTGDGWMTPSECSMEPGDNVLVTPDRPVWVVLGTGSLGIKRHTNGVLRAKRNFVAYEVVDRWRNDTLLVMGRNTFLSEDEARAKAVASAKAELDRIERQTNARIAKLRAVVDSNGQALDVKS
jgi:vancomycin permeability regulator SanA